MASEEDFLDSPNEFILKVGKKALTKEQEDKLEKLLKTFDFNRNVDLRPGGKEELASWCPKGSCMPITSDPCALYNTCRIERAPDPGCKPVLTPLCKPVKPKPAEPQTAEG
jgi:hypothetical protein